MTYLLQWGYAPGTPEAAAAWKEKQDFDAGKHWDALYQDADRVIQLLQLYQRRIEVEDDDETWLMLH